MNIIKFNVILFGLFFVMACEHKKSNVSRLIETNPTALYECAGSLDIKINFSSPVSNKLKIIWNGEIAVDECNNQKLGPIILKKEGHTLIVSDGGFGYTAPQFLDLQIFDQGLCDQQLEIFTIDNYKVSEDKPELCESKNAEFSE